MRISIITATYNCEGTILDCLKSVADQTYSDVEHIVIDGASVDATLRIVRTNAERVDRIISEPDHGIYDALNKGISHASGEIIGFLHADDIYSNDTVLAGVATAFQNPDVDAVYGDLTYVHKDNTDHVVRYWRSGQFRRSKLAKGWMPPHPTLYLRRRIYERFGSFDLSYQIAADYDFMLRIMKSAELNAVYLPRVLVKMRVGGESNRSVRNILRKSAEDLRALRHNQVGGLGGLMLKNTSKLMQFINQPTNR